VIADLNPVLRGWGQYFRTGNAAVKFIQIDTYVEERLRGLLLKRAGSRLRGGRADTWNPSLLRGLGTLSPARHDSVSGGCVMRRPERPPVSRVREIRTHGLNGRLALTRSARPTGEQ
jgi:hypothetical protein